MLKIFSTRFCLVTAAVILISACANSVVLSTVYDRFGTQTAKRFKSYATFNAAQKQEIDAFARSYHSWHRTTQLDRYSTQLREMVVAIEGSEALSFEQADSWLQSIRRFSDDMRACNPFNVSAEFLSELSDKQVEEVAAKMRSNLNERSDKYSAESAVERIERRFKDIVKWARRSGISFNDKQKRLLRETLTEQISMGAQRYELRRVWTEEFISLLGKRDETAFKANIMKHINSQWRLTESKYPKEWRSNERLWTGFIKDFINLQKPEQRVAFVAKALSTATTFEKLADKEVKLAPVCHSNN